MWELAVTFRTLCEIYLPRISHTCWETQAGTSQPADQLKTNLGGLTLLLSLSPGRKAREREKVKLIGGGLQFILKVKTKVLFYFSNTLYCWYCITFSQLWAGHSYCALKIRKNADDDDKYRGVFSPSCFHVTLILPPEWKFGDWFIKADCWPPL